MADTAIRLWEGIELEGERSTVLVRRLKRGFMLAGENRLICSLMYTPSDVM